MSKRRAKPGFTFFRDPKVMSVRRSVAISNKTIRLYLEHLFDLLLITQEKYAAIFSRIALNFGDDCVNNSPLVYVCIATTRSSVEHIRLGLLATILHIALIFPNLVDDKNLPNSVCQNGLRLALRLSKSVANKIRWIFHDN